MESGKESLMEGSREQAQKEEGMTQSAVMCLLWASLSLQV